MIKKYFDIHLLQGIFIACLAFISLKYLRLNLIFFLLIVFVALIREIIVFYKNAHRYAKEV
jgi:hypothetical protein